MMSHSYGVIATVRPGSLAAELDLRPGDQVVSINGHVLRDVIDYQFYSAEEELEIITLRDGEEHIYEVERDYGQEVGIEFAVPTFDGIRRCACHCDFCFVRQMPPGLRPSLYVRDDDYRYSFLFGNFITLTNLEDKDWQRLEEQRLSPLYVSVHATEPDLRRRLLGCLQAADIVAQLRRLGDLGIQVHAQIVLVPGFNDGAALERTIADLALLYPTVQSIAIVPVGLTRYHWQGLRTLSGEEAVALIQQVESAQAVHRHTLGMDLIYLSDEIYLLARKPIPPAERYDGFPQLENGVGLTRQLLDEWEGLRGSVVRGRVRCQRATLVCGTLIAPLLGEIAAEWSALSSARLDVLSVANRFFGSTVTVSGLLVGQDVVNTLQGRDLGERVILPRAMFDAEGQRTLDEMTPAEIGERLGVPVALAADLHGVLSLMCRPSL